MCATISESMFFLHVSSLVCIQSWSSHVTSDVTAFGLQILHIFERVSPSSAYNATSPACRFYFLKNLWSVIHRWRDARSPCVLFLQNQPLSLPAGDQHTVMEDQVENGMNYGSVASNSSGDSLRIHNSPQDAS